MFFFFALHSRDVAGHLTFEIPDDLLTCISKKKKEGHNTEHSEKPLTIIVIILLFYYRSVILGLGLGLIVYPTHILMIPTTLVRVERQMSLKKSYLD